MMRYYLILTPLHFHINFQNTSPTLNDRLLEP